MSKNIVLQWGEMPTSVAYIGTGQIMGWGNKAIEIRNVETGHLDGVFMHKKAQRLKFLCERNDKVNLIFAIQRTELNILCIQNFFFRPFMVKNFNARLGWRIAISSRAPSTWAVKWERKVQKDIWDQFNSLERIWLKIKTKKNWLAE